MCAMRNYAEKKRKIKKNGVRKDVETPAVEWLFCKERALFWPKKKA